jgi:hypothetical protein
LNMYVKPPYADPKAVSDHVTERHRAIAQRIGVVAKAGLIVEVIEITLEDVDDQSRLPTAAGLAASEESGGVR